MRKTNIFAFTAAAVLAAATVQPMTALAANRTYGVTGNGQGKIVIGEVKGLNVQELLGNQNINCDVWGNGRPDVNQPICPERPDRPAAASARH